MPSADISLLRHQETSLVDKQGMRPLTSFPSLPSSPPLAEAIKKEIRANCSGNFDFHFLDASSHLYMRVVHLSVNLSVRPLFLFKHKKKEKNIKLNKSIKNERGCIGWLSPKMSKKLNKNVKKE